MVPGHFLFVFTELLRERVGQLVYRRIKAFTFFFDDEVVARKVHGYLRYLSGLFDFQNDVRFGVLMSKFLYAVFNFLSGILLNRISRIDVEEGDAYVDYFC